MKKLLVLMLVLGMVSAANAAMTLKISVDGVVDVPDSEISILPSQFLDLDIWSSGYNSAADAMYCALVVDTKYGTITGGVVLIPPAPSFSSMQGPSAVADGFPGLLADEDGPYGAIAGSPAGEVAPAGTYIDGFLFHCEAIGDATIRLITTPDFENWAVADMVTIHQIPEPATMLLLGLGGLFLRRRK
jgi:hypothetical protein